MKIIFTALLVAILVVTVHPVDATTSTVHNSKERGAFSGSVYFRRFDALYHRVLANFIDGGKHQKLDVDAGIVDASMEKESNDHRLLNVSFRPLLQPSMAQIASNISFN
jgi:hypothetical protein